MQPIYASRSAKDLYDEFFDQAAHEPEKFSDESAYPIRQALKYSNRGGLVLECGCGPGRIVTHLMASGVRVVGMDIHRPSLIALKQRHPEAMIVAADAAALPFKENCFDTVLSFAALSYVPERPSPREFRRVLKSHGWLVTTMYHCSLFQLLLAIRSKFARKEKQFLMWCVPAREWRRLLAEYGFRPRRTEYTLYRFSLARYLPWLVRNRHYSYHEMRDGDRIELNRMGTILWRLFSLAPRVFANHYCVASSLDKTVEPCSSPYPTSETGSARNTVARRAGVAS